MNDITPAQIKQQYNRIKKAGWIVWFRENAKRANTTTAHLIAIGSRETNLQNIKGDFRNGIYNGYGVMQVDVKTDLAFTKSWTKAAVQPSIERGTDIYISKVKDTLACVGKTVSVKGKSFVGRKVEADDLRRVATAAYNCGRWAHYNFSNHINIDARTTGKEYSRSVYDRAIEFARLLEADGEANATANEVRLQGKYARAEHVSQYLKTSTAVSGDFPTPNALNPPVQPSENPSQTENSEQPLIQTTSIEQVGTTAQIATETNEQSVNESAEIKAPEPQGVFAKLTGGVSALFSGTLIYTIAEKAGAISLSQTALILIIVLVTIAFIGFCFWAFLDAWKANNRVKHELESKTNIDRKDVVWK